MKLPKERRQVEIISLICSVGDQHSVADLCDLFYVEIATIHRDLQELRSLGLSIHSLNGRVRVTRPLTEKDLQMLLSRYAASVGDAIAFPKSTSLLVKKQKIRSLQIFSALVRAIEQHKVLEIHYYKMFDDTFVTRIVEPYQLFSTSRDWLLIARSDGIFKHFLLQNIKEIKETKELFRRSRDFDPAEFHRLSFEYWTGEEAYPVQLKFSKKVAHTIKNGIWGEDQEISRGPDGSVILKIRVNSLQQLGIWILSWGGDVTVLKPASLRQELVRKAKAFASTNLRRSN